MLELYKLVHLSSEIVKILHCVHQSRQVLSAACDARLFKGLIVFDHERVLRIMISLSLVRRALLEYMSLICPRRSRSVAEGSNTRAYLWLAILSLVARSLLEVWLCSASMVSVCRCNIRLVAADTLRVLMASFTIRLAYSCILTLLLSRAFAAAVCFI